MKLYFAEKIQLTIMKKRTIDLVQEQSPSQKNKGKASEEDKETQKTKNQSLLDSCVEKSERELKKPLCESENDSDDMAEKAMPMPENPLRQIKMKAAVSKLAASRNQAASLAKIREGRSKRLVYTMKIESQNHEEDQKQMEGVLNDFASWTEKNDHLVKGNLNSQLESIEKRIQEKSKSMNIQ